MAKTQSDIILTLKAEGLNNLEELKARIKQVKDEFSRAKIGSDEFYNSAKKLQELNSAYRQLNSTASSSTSSLKSLYFTLGTIQRGALLAGGAILGLVEGFIKLAEFAKEGARFELLRATLSSIAKREGVDFEELFTRIDKVTGGTVSKLEKLQAIMKLHTVGVGWEQIVDIIAIADDKSKILGESIDSIIDKLTLAAMGSQRAMRSLLIPVDVEEAQKRFAARLGVTVKELSDAGKQQAVFNEIIRKAKEQVEELQPAQKENVENIERLETAWNNFLETLKELAVTLTPILEVITRAIDLIDKELKAISPLFGVGVKKQEVELKTDSSGKQYYSDDYYGARMKELEESRRMLLANAPQEIKKEITTKTTKTTQEPSKKSYIDAEAVSKKQEEAQKKRYETTVKEAEIQLKLTKNVEQYVASLREAQKLTTSKVEKSEIELKIQEAITQNTKEQRERALKTAQLQYEITGNAEQYLDVIDNQLKTSTDEVEKLELQKLQLNIINDAVQKRKQQEKDVLDELKRQYESLSLASKTMISGISRGFSQLANEIADIWQSRVLAKLVGNTRTAFAIIIDAIVQEFTSLGARLASMQVISWLFPSLGGFNSVLKIFGFQHGGVIDEPIIGKGLQTGAYYAFGERAPMVPELIRPINQSMQYNAVQTVKPMIEVVPIVGADKLSVMVKYGDQRRSRRYM